MNNVNFIALKTRVPALVHQELRKMLFMHGEIQTFLEKCVTALILEEKEKTIGEIFEETKTERREFS